MPGDPSRTFLAILVLMKSSPELIRIFGATHVGPTALWSASVRLLVPTLPVNLSSRTLVFCLCGYCFVACRAVVLPWRGARAVPFPCNTIFTVSISRWCNVVCDSHHFSNNKIARALFLRARVETTCCAEGRPDDAQAHAGHRGLGRTQRGLSVSQPSQRAEPQGHASS